MTRKTKTELIAAVSMLLVAAVMLSSASFAWMTISQAPEVSNLKISMGVTANLEIAKATTDSAAPAEVTYDDHGDETKWGAKVTSFTAANGINWPVVTSDNAVYTVAFDEGGRTNGITQVLNPVADGSMTNGVIAYKADINTGLGGTVSRTVQAGYGVWLRSNQELTSVTATADVSGLVCKRGGETVTGVTADVSIKVYPGALTTTPIIVPADGSATFGLTKNVAKLVVITVGVSGGGLIAKDFTSGSALTIEGINITFKDAAEMDQQGNLK